MSRSTEAACRIVGWLVRGALVALWALAGWGTLLLLATLFGILSAGPGVALARLAPPHGASLWGWLNALSVLFTLAAWLIAAGLFVWGRWLSEEKP